MPYWIKLGTNYPWVKEIQVCSNKGPGLLQRGDNHKNVNMGWVHLKIFYSRITWPIFSSPGRLSGELLSWPRCRRRRHTSRKKL
jgi:hypothetical protein